METQWGSNWVYFNKEKAKSILAEKNTHLSRAHLEPRLSGSAHKLLPDKRFVDLHKRTNSCYWNETVQGKEPLEVNSQIPVACGIFEVSLIYPKQTAMSKSSSGELWPAMLKEW